MVSPENCNKTASYEPVMALMKRKLIFFYTFFFCTAHWHGPRPSQFRPLFLEIQCWQVCHNRILKKFAIYLYWIKEQFWAKQALHFPISDLVFTLHTLQSLNLITTQYLLQYVYFVIQFYPWLNFYILLFQTYYYHTQKRSFLMCGSLVWINISIMWKQNIIIWKCLTVPHFTL